MAFHPRIVQCSESVEVSGVQGRTLGCEQPHRADVVVYGPMENNPEGDKAFRKDRALWYQSIKGEPLTGTLAEQWEKADVLARSFRVDKTRSGRPRPSS